MNLWKSILQNISCGCVGALLVLGVAHAQNPAATQSEIRTHKLLIVGNDGSEVGYFGEDRDGPILRLSSGDYSLQLLASKRAGASALIGSTHDRSINLAVNSSSASLGARSGNCSSVSLLADDLVSSMMLSKDGYSTDSKHVIKTAVDANDSDIELVGPAASVSVGHAPQQSLGGIFCRMHNPSGAALTLSNDKNRVYWSQFPPDASRK